MRPRVTAMRNKVSVACKPTTHIHSHITTCLCLHFHRTNALHYEHELKKKNGHQHRWSVLTWEEVSRSPACVHLKASSALFQIITLYLLIEYMSKYRVLKKMFMNTAVLTRFVMYIVRSPLLHKESLSSKDRINTDPTICALLIGANLRVTISPALTFQEDSDIGGRQSWAKPSGPWIKPSQQFPSVEICVLLCERERESAKHLHSTW